MTVRRGLARATAVAASAAICAAGVATIAAGTASAAPPAAVLQVTGTDIVPVPAGPCFGTIHVDFEVVPGHPDQTTVNLTPNGTYGSIPGCEVPVNVSWQNGIAPFNHVESTLAANGRTSTTITAGQGLSLVSVGAGAYLGGLPSWVSSGYLWL
ncbi:MULTISPECIES: hypothetical protein [Rhodococcus]|jgi:hypothetical protein|uniref:Uncharacterized protein n=2 Tax=Rhodococcus erythropolis group TaxID=2840174 RepID=A0ABV5XPB1_9NOCA|nr:MULTISPECIES: hypothetical protein [Rhodococcus]AZI65617.1 hypothetical protein EHW12_31345 [Rhodococcus sp. NJ-530]KSU63028.1 hypothetical protein AS032_33685 [Rhodococcus qingshengii]MDJ0440262.1 hypothetical protein [Rhodococcus qingshengii]SCC70329.1 hypothetical protein GA0061093_13914 [Rhodococcus qingshengii]